MAHRDGDIRMLLDRLPSAAQTALLFLVASSLSGCIGCASRSSITAPGGSATEALRRCFPEQATEVLAGGRPVVPVEGGFTFDREREGGPVAHLPGSALEPVRFQVSLDREIKVRERGLVGDGTPAERSVSYAREDGASHWTATPAGYEEWLHLTEGSAERGRVVASWEIEGASPREAGAAIDLVDEAGAPQLRMTAPRAYAVGGRPLEATLAVEGTSVVLRVDAGGDEVLVDPLWVPTASMATPRYYAVAALLPSGKVLAASGFGTTWTPSAEIYDPAAGTWSAAAPLQIARAGATATVLGSGKVLVVGGYDGAYLGAELYDPTANTWSAAGAMITPRSVHTSALLPSGKVLVAGGFTTGAVATVAAEVYDAATNAWSSAAPSATPAARPP
jgi:hypothetical protein